MSRVIYRMKHKFRSDKGFKTLEKINRALLQYLNMDYTQNLKTFLSMIDTEDLQQPAYLQRLVYLPTKQLLQFILVRTQGLGKLLIRIIESCQITADYMNSRFRLGQSWPLALLVLGLASRIHTISVFLVKETCHFYDALVKYENVLKLNGQVWLQDGYKFPDQLLPWLDFNISEKLEINQSVNSSDSLFQNISVNSNGARIKDPLDISSKGSPSDLLDLRQDLGLIIARDTFPVSSENLQKRKKLLHKDKIRNKNVNLLNDICDAYTSRQGSDLESKSAIKKVKSQENGQVSNDLDSNPPKKKAKLHGMDNKINEMPNQRSYMQKLAENNCNMDLGLPISREEFMAINIPKKSKKKKARDENSLNTHKTSKKLPMSEEVVKVKKDGSKTNKLKKLKNKIKKIGTP